MGAAREALPVAEEKNPSSYRSFMQTGNWTDGTIFILEARGAKGVSKYFPQTKRVSSKRTLRDLKPM